MLFDCDRYTRACQKARAQVRYRKGVGLACAFIEYHVVLAVKTLRGS